MPWRADAAPFFERSADATPLYPVLRLLPRVLYALACRSPERAVGRYASLGPVLATQLQHEFVGALLRLAMLRHKVRLKQSSIPVVGVIGQAFDVLIKQQIAPRIMKLDAADPIKVALRGRGCKAVRLKFEEKLRKLFDEFARDAPVPGATAAKKKEQETMNLGELVSMLKEAQVLDDKCTVREVATAGFKRPRSHATEKLHALSWWAVPRDALAVPLALRLASHGPSRRGR